MKIFLFLLISILSFHCFGQNPANYQYRNVFERSRGAMFDSALHIPRYNGAPSGLRTGSSTQAGALSMDTTNHLVKYYSGSIWRDIQPIRDGLYSGGIVTWDSLLVFTVSAAVYYIGGQRYETDITHITLDAANGSNPRIDLIVATTSGISKITGTAAASPAEANLPIDNIRLTAIYVNTSATIPTGPITKIIWDENTEFTGAATSVTTDFDNFTDPYHFLKATSAGAVTSSSFITYTGTDFAIAPYTVFKMFVKLKAVFTNTTRFQLTWYKDGVQVSTTLNISTNTYGFLRNSLTYQEITIPVSDFGISTAEVDMVKISLSGSNGSGFYLDYIQLKGGLPLTTGGTRFGVAGEDAAATQARYFNGKNGTFFHIDSVPLLVFTATETRFKNLANNSWLIYQNSGLTIDPLSTSIPVTINNIPYSSSVGVVHLGLDTTLSPPRLVRKTAGGTTPTLQEVTTAGNTTTNSIIVDNANIDAIGGSSFRVKDDNGNVAAVLWYNANDYGELRFKTGATGTMNVIPQNSTANNDLYLPKTGNTDDTIATLHNLRKSLTKSITIETPSASESIGVWKTPVAITVSSLAAVVVGSASPSVTVNIAFGTDRTSGTNVFSSGQTVTSTTTGHTFNSSFNDATIPAGSFIWIITTAQSGTVTQVELTINYTED